MTIFLIALLVVFSFLLIKSADIVLLAVKRLGDQTRIGRYALSAIILAIGTSFPEMSVGITSAVQGVPLLSFGDVIGSNIANISLVLGIAGLSAGSIYVRGKLLKRDVWIALVSGVAPLILLSDGAITRPDAVMLLGIYVAYSFGFFKARYVELGREFEVDRELYRFLRSLKQFDLKSSKSRNVLRLFAGLLLLVISAAVIVRISMLLAMNLGLPIFAVGLIMVAIGTSLPELAFSFRALKDHEPGMFFGNILGSTIANSTLIVGVVAIIEPIRNTEESSFLIAGVAFVLMSVMLWFFARTKRRIDWWEALLMLVLYVSFVAAEFCNCVVL